MSLNISQDLSSDLENCFAEESKHHLLPDLLRRPLTTTAERVLTAITWYNRANSLSNDEASSILDLGVAFETLLGLPRDGKTNRFIDAVHLLLGRVSRLDVWAQQFYEVRSEVAHEGKTHQLRFMPTGKNRSGEGLYQSLLSYGRQIFQLSVSTLLFGDHLASRAGLQDMLVTNQERFESISKILDDETLPIIERFAAVDPVLNLISDFRYVHDTTLSIETMIGAAKRAATRLLQSGVPSEPVLRQRMENLATVKRSADLYEALGAIRELTELKSEMTENRTPLDITLRLVEVIWRYTFMHYYWLEEQRRRAASNKE
jgi:hypothetical protein